eukprot:m.26352 g.26352  ORF g.26352 m.26352 type:complete len:103 (+) comp29262_c0_seq1:417-725(+)
MFYHNRTKFHIIDTVGFDDTNERPQEVIEEMLKAVTMAKNGVDALLIVINTTARLNGSVKMALEEIQKLKNFWGHALVVFNKASIWGDTEEEVTQHFHTDFK